MKHYHRQRLLKLAAHLESGQLSHKEFNFSFFHLPFGSLSASLATPEDANLCGFAGCAVGECPAVFPKRWRMARFGPKLKGTRGLSTLEQAQKDFDLRQLEVQHLFIPGEQKPSTFGGRFLSDKATRRQVARNIRIFVAKSMKPGGFYGSNV